MGISEISMIGMINKVGGFENPKYFPILTPSSPIPTTMITILLLLHYHYHYHTAITIATLPLQNYHYI